MSRINTPQTQVAGDDFPFPPAPKHYTIRGAPMREIARDPIMSLEQSDIHDGMMSFRVRRFKAGQEVASFRAFVGLDGILAAQKALPRPGAKSSAAELFTKLYEALEPIKVTWELEQSATHTLASFGNVTFSTIPESAHELAKRPKMWGKEMIRRSDGSKTYAFEASASQRDGKWLISCEQIPTGFVGSVFGNPRQLSALMSPLRYAQFKHAITGELPTKDLVRKFFFNRAAG